MKKYILGVVLSLGILASPTFTQAASLTDAQIQSILSLLSVFGADSATVASVNSALTGTTPTTETTPAFCFKTTSDLTVGSTGSGVSELNQALTLSGVNTNGNTSVFDENVAADVVSFQAKYGIRQTGYVGPMTRGKLKALYGCSTSPRTGEFCGGIRGLLCAAEYSCKLDGQYPDAGGTCVKTDSVRPLPPPTSSRIPSTTPVPTSINVLYPTAGMTVTKGQSVTIAWESLGSSANYYVISRSTGGKGAIGTYSASQAHCDAASKCYVSWVPDFNDPNVTIFIQDTPSLLSGTSGSFAIVSPSSTQPSIHLSVSSGNQINDSSISVNVGGTFTISGTPQNLQGMSYYSGNGYPTSGYYNRAYFFDQNFSNNNSCGNNDASPTGVWTMTCTAKVSGSSSFYVEIYANGQIYRSNQVTVTIPNTTTLTPTITVVSPNGGEILTPGQTYTIRWSSQNIPSGARIRITIMNGTRGTNADPNTTIVTNLPANATSYTWTVSQNTNNWGIGMASPLRKLVNLLARTTYAGSDQYMIGIIVDNPAGETAYDRSDNSFTITTSTLTTTSTIPNISYINPTTISAGSTVYVYGSNLYGNPFSL
ncbi:hypothetical protein EXS57_03020, partial [Candidatus Kaiserbacteria bacterium]|nr:hypothetical protein [Candidatus Kaiserbacteria bacterium]